MATVERQYLATPDRVPTFDVTGWMLRISAAGLFLGVGLTKFNSDSWRRERPPPSHNFTNRLDGQTGPFSERSE